MKSVTLANSNTSNPDRHHLRDGRRTFAEKLIATLFIVDFLVVVAALFLSYGIRFRALAAYGEDTADVTLQKYLGHIAVGATFMMVLLVNFRVYNTHRILSFGDAANGIAKATVVWLLGFMGVSLILRFEPSISRLFCAVAFAQTLIALLSWRLLFIKLLEREPLAGRLRERVLFVGWNAECERITKLLGRGIRHPFEIAGVVPTNQNFEAPSAGLDMRVLEGGTEWRGIISSEEIDVVMAPDSAMSREELANLSLICEKEMVDFKIIPSSFQILLSGLHLESISGVPVLGVSKLPLHSVLNQALKRGVDFLGALVGLLLAAPLIALFGLLVYRESRGPIFYKQVRVGRNGKQFHIYKIRSMRLDSEVDGGARWAQKGDPRCLKVGAFMRKWNIDEVPQFWNVLKGEMSLVGPRPERPELIHNFREEIPHYNARHNIKPGITGWAQVNGLRGNTDLTERVKCDLYYIENWNLMLDIQIMAMTFFKRDNAY